MVLRDFRHLLKFFIPLLVCAFDFPLQASAIVCLHPDTLARPEREVGFESSRQILRANVPITSPLNSLSDRSHPFLCSEVTSCSFCPAPTRRVRRNVPISSIPHPPSPRYRYALP